MTTRITVNLAQSELVAKAQATQAANRQAQTDKERQRKIEITADAGPKPDIRKGVLDPLEDRPYSLLPRLTQESPTFLAFWSYRNPYSTTLYPSNLDLIVKVRSGIDADSSSGVIETVTDSTTRRYVNKLDRKSITLIPVPYNTETIEALKLAYCPAYSAIKSEINAGPFFIPYGAPGGPVDGWHFNSSPASGYASNWTYLINVDVDTVYRSKYRYIEEVDIVGMEIINTDATFQIYSDKRPDGTAMPPGTFMFCYGYKRTVGRNPGSFYGYVIQTEIDGTTNPEVILSNERIPATGYALEGTIPGVAPITQTFVQCWEVAYKRSVPDYKSVVSIGTGGLTNGQIDSLFASDYSVYPNAAPAYYGFYILPLDTSENP